MHNNVLLKIEALSHQYPNSSATIDFEDFSLEAKERMLVLGPSGCGKTTLLHLIAGILPIEKGEIYFQKNALSKLTSAQKDSLRGQNMGIVSQKVHFIAGLNLFENIVLAQRFSRKKLDKTYISTLLERLSIAHLAKKSLKKLSTGELQRFCIARALATKPALVLADEPTSALDDKNCQQVLELLLSLAQEHQSALLVITHDNRLTPFFAKKYAF